jgi:hypothetical protein
MTTFGATVGTHAVTRVAGRVTLAAFAAAILAGAFLVFIVQPLAAKLLLPRFGGSPAVWTTSLLFFQAALLVGYGWAHLTTSRLGRRGQPVAQIALLMVALVVLPIALPAWTTPPTDMEPAVWLLLVLAAAVGLPYVAVTTASPVLQRWFSWTDHPFSADPYFLYAAGNIGSLGGLLAYPFLVEPNLSVADQAAMWTAGYVLFVVLTVAAMVLLARHGRPTTTAPTVAASTASTTVSDDAGSTVEEAPAELEDAAPTMRRRLSWIAMAFVPSSLMLGVTTFITADLAAVPLLWVLPLSLYLLTFILAFSPRNPLTPRLMALLLPVAVVALSAALVGAIDLSTGALVALDLGVFFVAAMLAHGRLAADRPGPSRLTEFYFLLALGGALGGVFNALLAPVLFDTVIEYPLAIVLALFLRPARPATDARAERRARLLDLVVPTAVLVGTLVALVLASRVLGIGGEGLSLVLSGIAVGLLVLVRRPVRFALSIGVILLLPLVVGQGTVTVERSFYGVNRVEDHGDLRLLIHGTTNHGGQHLDEARAREPLTYYHRSGPFGRTLEAYRALHPGPIRFGVIGLGAGGIAAYARPGDEITFFEIDPAVVRIAQDPALFTYLSGAPEPVRVVVGDGRLTLTAEPDRSLDVLILDAFSGDAPPAHLLTLEALGLYESKIAPGGLLLANVSNRYLDLPAVMETGLAAMSLEAFVPEDPEPDVPSVPEKEPSVWIADSPDPDTIATLRDVVPGRDIEPRAGLRTWTDDFSDLVSVIRW